MEGNGWFWWTDRAVHPLLFKLGVRFQDVAKMTLNSRDQRTQPWGSPEYFLISNFVHFQTCMSSQLEFIPAVIRGRQGDTLGE